MCGKKEDDQTQQGPERTQTAQQERQVERDGPR